MRIITIGRALEKIGGGAERSLLSLVSWLKGRHEVVIFNFSHKPLEDTESMVNRAIRKLPLIHIPQEFPLNYCYAMDKLKMLAEEFKPDLIISQKPPFPIKLPNIPCIVFVRDLDYILYFAHKNAKSPIGRIKYIVEMFAGRKILAELKKVDLVIANSGFVAKSLKSFSIEAEVVYPFIDISEYRVEREAPEYLTFISGILCNHKGFDVFRETARDMPDKKFLAVGRDPSNEMKTAPKNMEWISWTKDMRKVYRKTKMLLVPSQWEEPFGRVVVEAQANGIPVIASDIGGLPEAVGEGGKLVSQYDDNAEWIKSIESLIDDNSQISKLSKAAKNNSKKFSVERILEMLRLVVSNKLGIEL